MPQHCLKDLQIRFGGLALATVTRLWMRTLDYKSAYYDVRVDPVADPEATSMFEHRIYVFWHEYIPFQFYLRGHCNVAMLLSRNRDAEWLARAARHMGFQTIRGSTYRGANGALRQLLASSQSMNLTMTPDGPRGPRRRMSLGPIYLSSKLGLPLVAIGMGYDRPWRLPTWDRFAIPRPMSRARAVWSPPLRIPRFLDREGMQQYRQRVEILLDRMTLEAEAWAAAGTPKLNQLPTRRQALPHGAYRVHGPRSRKPLTGSRP